MLIDKIDNIAQYNYFPENIQKSLYFLQNTDFINIVDGKYNIDGEDIFYIVQRYKTQLFENGKLETHKKYLDIQYIVSGEEILGYAPNSNLKIINPYDEIKDITFYAKPENLSAIRLTEKMFCVLYPNAAHMPGRYFIEPKEVLKIVVKIKL